MNTASRLQSVAEPGTVLVGETTFRATRPRDRVRAGRRAHAEGQGEPVPRVARAPRARRARRRRPRRGDRAAVRRPRRGAPAGQGARPRRPARGEGPARLGDRDRRDRQVAARLGAPQVHRRARRDVLWHHGRCPSYGDGVTFWALGEMVRMRAGIAETDDPATSRRKLSASVAELVPDQEERRWIEPRLAHLLGLDDPPRRRPRGAVRRVADVLRADRRARAPP